MEESETGLFRRREPFAFMLYLAIFGSSLLFLFILLVFLRKEWVNQDIGVPLLPIFWISTGLIVLSSFLLQDARQAFSQEKFQRYRRGLILVNLLGASFMGTQLYGWKLLFDLQITMANDTGGSFLYILSGLHVFHTAGGLIALGIALRDAFRHRQYIDSFVYAVNPPNQLRLKLISIYWHFVDVLWVFLFLFLVFHAR